MKLSDGITRNIESVQSRFASYVFRARAYCAINSVAIGLNSAYDFYKSEQKKKKSMIKYFSDNILSCTLSHVAQEKRRFVLRWEYKDEVNIIDKAREVPNFLYRFYRLFNNGERRSFESHTVDNASRYANMFTVFFLFFKYGQLFNSGTGYLFR